MDSVRTQFTSVLALYDAFGVDVPLNFDITHSLITRTLKPILLGESVRLASLSAVSITNFSNLFVRLLLNVMSGFFCQGVVEFLFVFFQDLDFY